MQFDKYQICKNINEIVRIFEKLRSSKTPIIIWQNTGRKDRVVSNSVIHSIDIKSRNIVVVPSEESLTPYKFKKNITLYMHGEERSIVFKSTNFIANKSKIIIRIPDEVQLVEHRENPRFGFTKQSSRTVMHKKEVGLQGSGNFKNFTINCYDISQSGLGLELHAHHLLRYQIGDMIEIKSISNILIPNGLKGEIVYICPVLEKQDIKIFRAGLKFLGIIDSDILKKILHSSRESL